MNTNEAVSRGLCVGCGACSVVHDQSINIVRTNFQTYLPDFNSTTLESIELVDRVCPFSDNSPNESEIAESLFGGFNLNNTNKTGYYKSFGAGRITDEKKIIGSSSGGLTSWFLSELFILGEVDGVIHVSSSECDDRLFDFTVSHSIEEIENRRKSQYYAVEFSDIINKIKGNGKRYAFVGVPCYVKAIRSVAKIDVVLREQLVWHIGLVCGHMKSGAFGELMADQLGVNPANIEKIDFRVKDPKKSVHSYSFGVLEKSKNVWKTATSKKMLGGNWGHALFQLKACDYCDDIFAETADICFGDAWLQKYESKWQGTNIFLIRRPAAVDMFSRGVARGAVDLEDISFDDLIHTQSGNFRHRHEGLSYRLLKDKEIGLSVPKKRIIPGQYKLSWSRRKIIEIRQKMAERSHVSYFNARSAGDMSIFIKR